MNILVTGGTGFIGRHLVSQLIKIGYKPKLLVRKTSNISYFRENSVEFVYGDIQDFASLKNAFCGIDIVFHCAAEVANHPKEKLFTANVLGTENVCRAAFETGVKKLIYLSSVSVISGNTNNPLTDGLPYIATNPYGVSKIKAEKIVLQYRDKGLKVAIFRPCMVYGEDEPHLFKLILKLLKFRMLPILGSGDKLLHLVYVENVVQVLISVLENEAAFNGTYIVADKEILTAKEFLGLVSSALGVKPPRYIPMWFVKIFSWIPCEIIKNVIKFYSKDRSYDISRIEKYLNYKPLLAREAIIKSVRAFKWK